MIAGKVHRLELQRILGEQWRMGLIDLTRARGAEPLPVQVVER